jgi:hypothetical protein
MLAAEKTRTLADMIPTRNMRKGGATKANSTAVVPRSHETRLGLCIAIMAQPNRIQVVLVIDKGLITLSPENKGV